MLHKKTHKHNRKLHATERFLENPRRLASNDRMVEVCAGSGKLRFSRVQKNHPGTISWGIAKGPGPNFQGNIIKGGFSCIFNGILPSRRPPPLFVCSTNVTQHAGLTTGRSIAESRMLASKRATSSFNVGLNFLLKCMCMYDVRVWVCMCQGAIRTPLLRRDQVTCVCMCDDVWCTGISMYVMCM